MVSAIESRPFDFGLVVWTVRVANLTARGTAPEGQRPRLWTVRARRGRWAAERVSAATVRGLGLLRGRQLAAALAGVERGRV